MGLFGCFGMPEAPPPRECLSLAVTSDPASHVKEEQEHPVLSGRQPLAEPDSEVDALAVLHISGDRPTECSTLRVCGPSSSGSSQGMPRVTCRLSTSAKASSGPSWDLQLPHACSRTGDPWLRVQPVAANDDACATWGIWDLSVLAQALMAFVDGQDTLLAAMAEVALCLAAPWDVLQSLRPPPQPVARQCSIPGGGSVSIRGSYIRDPQDGTLSPALVLTLQGVTLTPQLSTPPPSDLGPLGLPPRYPRTSDPQGFSSGRPSATQTSQPEASSSKALALQQQRPGRGRGWLSDRVIHEHAASMLASVSPGTRKQRQRAKDELLRARSMLSTVPCIATLLDLSAEYDPEQLICTLRSENGAEAPPTNSLSGRVLMQNAQSLNYWGKLRSRKKSGVRDMLALLFKDDPGACLELQQLQHQPDALGQQDEHSEGWKRVVQVPISARPRWRPRRSLRIERVGTGETAGGMEPQSSDVALAGVASPSGVYDGIPVSPFRSGAPDMEQPRRSPILLEGSTSQGQVSSSWISSTSRHSLSTVDRRRTSPSGKTLDGYVPSLGNSGKFPRSQGVHMEVVGGEGMAIEESTYVTEALDEEGVEGVDIYEGMPGTVESFAPSAFHRSCQPMIHPYERPSNAARRLSNSAARNSSTSLSFPQLPEVNPPSVSTRVMKLSLLTAAGSSASGGASGPIDLRQRSHIELHQNSLSPASAGRRIASMSCVEPSPLQGMRTAMQQPQHPSKPGTRAPPATVRNTVPTHGGRPSHAGPTSQGRLMSVHSLQPSWTRVVATSGEAGDEPGSSQVTSPSTDRDRDKLSPMTPGARGQFQESGITVVTPRRGGSMEAIMDVDDLPVNVRHRRLQASMSADHATRRLAREQQRRQHEDELQQEYRQVLMSGSGNGNAFFGVESEGVEEDAGGASDSTDSEDSYEGDENGWTNVSAGDGQRADGAGEEHDDDEEDLELTHEVQALRVVDPVTGLPAILLLQTDITARALMEKRMSALTETQLTMLENMLPRQVLEYAIGGAGPIGSLAYQHDQVTVLFMDIVGFTSMSKNVEPHLVMGFLNNLFSKLDEMCEAFDIYKVDTAGDCYIVAGALMTVDEDGFIALDEDADPRQGARNVVAFAQEIMYHVQTVYMPHDGRPTSVRVGIHTGSAVSGLVGTKMFKFSLFGDTMNTSSRMESTSRPGCIQISSATYDILDEDQRELFTPTGGVEVKGKGLMATYVYAPDSSSRPIPDVHLGAIVEEGVDPHADLYSTPSGDVSRGNLSTSVGRVTAGLFEVESGSGVRVTDPVVSAGEGHESREGGKQRRRSTESTSRPVSVCSSATGSGAANITAHGGSRARRSSFASYGTSPSTSTGRRPESVVADMFRAAAAVMEQQQPQQREGGFSKFIQCNAKPSSMSNK